MSGTIIKTKYSTTSASPVDGSLQIGEMAYSFTSEKLFIGDDSVTVHGDIIGGKYFTDLLDHPLGTLTPDSAILVDSNKKIDVLNVDYITLDDHTISTTDANGHLILNPNGSGEVQVQASALAVVGNLTVSGTSTTIGGSTLGNINIADNTVSAINPDNGDIILTPKGTGDVILSGTQTLMLPKGGNIGAVAADTGKIRYNTTDNRFEGVVSGAWTGLGGVTDLDQDTKITVESNANDDDTIRFFVGQSNVATEKGNIDSTGLNVDVINEFTANSGILLTDNVNIGTVASPANLILSGNLTVEGTTTSVNSTVTTLSDPVIKVGEGSLAAGDALDRGVSFEYGDTTAVKVGFFGMDMQLKRFVFKLDVGAPDNQEYSAPWNDAQFGSLYLEGDSNVTGDSITSGTSTSFGNFTVGTSKFVVTAASGNTDIQGTLDVLGITTLAAGLNANGGINVDSGKFIVADATGNVSTQGTLSVDGAVTLKSTVDLGSTGQMKITAAGVMTHGVIDGTGVVIDCGTF